MPTPPPYSTVTLTEDDDIYRVNQPFVDIYALGGDDIVTVFPWASSVRVFGGDGNDTVMGGQFSDTMYGGAGDDFLDEGRVEGYSGDDFLYGGSGNDRISAGSGDDTVYAGVGRDVVYGGLGFDNIDGGLWSDELYGGQGDDQLYGRDGNDQLYGNAGNDELWGGAGNDYLYGGGGSDWYADSFESDGSDHIKDLGGDHDALMLFPANLATSYQEIVIGVSANGHNLLIASTQVPQTQLTIINQFATGQIETFSVFHGATVTAGDINALLADMTAYIATQQTPVDLSDLAQVSADTTLMAMIATTFSPV